MNRILASVVFSMAVLMGFAVEPQYVKHDYIKGSTLIMTNVEEWVTNEIAELPSIAPAYEAATNALDVATNAYEMASNSLTRKEAIDGYSDWVCSPSVYQGKPLKVMKVAYDSVGVWYVAA